MDMKLTDDTIDNLARAIVLAPYKILAEGTTQWDAGDKYDFKKKAEGQPIEKQLSIFLAMRDRADATAQAIAKEVAARAARAPQEEAHFDAIRKATQERQKAKAEARDENPNWNSLKIRDSD